MSRIADRLHHCKSWVEKWVSRYESLGVKGLFDKQRSGRKTKLSKIQEEQIKTRIQNGPIAEDIVSVFRCKSIRTLIANEHHVEYAQSSIYDLLKRLGFSRIKPRPKHEKNNKELMDKWIQEIFPAKLKEVEEIQRGKEIEIWFQDEMRYGKKTRMTYEWLLSGTYKQQIKQLGYENRYIYGAVNPASGRHIGLVFSEVSTEAMNIHLSLISQAIPSNRHVILIMDQAGWHSSSTELKIPENISILDLPPYSPELNPVERLWKWVKENFLSNRVIHKGEDLLKIGCDVWNQITDEIVKSVCSVNFIPSTNFT